jgi:hypothetical protein
MNLKDTITAALGPVAVEFTAASLGGVAVWIKRLSAFEANAYFVSIKEKSAGQIAQLLVQRALVNNDMVASAVYEPGPKGLEEIAKLPNAFIEEIALEAQRVNALTAYDVKVMREDFFAKRASAGSTSSPATLENSTPTA